MDDRDQDRGTDGKPYKEGNVREDGSYVVGRSRPPAATRFAVGDGRPRGRRPKGAKNFDTVFAEESAQLVPVSENGKARRVTKQRAAIKRLYDNAIAKGQNAALSQVMEQSRRISDKPRSGDDSVVQSDLEILDAFLRQRTADLVIDPPVLGDPLPEEASDEFDPPEDDRAAS